MSAYRSSGKASAHLPNPQPAYGNVDRSSMLQPHGAPLFHNVAHSHSRRDHRPETHRRSSYQHPHGARTLQEHDFQQDHAAYQRAPLPPHDHPGYNSPVEDEDEGDMDQAPTAHNTHFIPQPREVSRNIKTSYGPLPGGYCPAPRISSSTNPFHRLLKSRRRAARNEVPAYTYGWNVNPPYSSSQPDILYSHEVDRTPSSSEPAESTESEESVPSNALGLQV